MQNPDLHGKTALVTGAGRGIGRSVAQQLAVCGARVVLVARSREQLEAAAQEIRDAGGDARALAVDIADAAAVERAFRESGPVDILINNAGVVQPIAPAVDADPASWAYNIAVNLNAVFYTCHYALPHMIEQGWGRIVNVTSGAARGTTTTWSAYSAAKAGVEAFTGVLAREAGPQGVRANAVRPGIVDTSMQAELRVATEEQFGRDNLDRFRGYKERGLLRSPEDPARLILWLLTPEADDINGETLAIDDPEVAARIGLVSMGR